MKQKDIADYFKVSAEYISKVVRNDVRYQEEKQRIQKYSRKNYIDKVKSKRGLEIFNLPKNHNANERKQHKNARAR